MSLAEYIAATAPEKAQIARERGWRIHRGPDDWKHDIAQSNSRALSIIAANRRGLPRPVFGAHRGVPTDA